MIMLEHGDKNTLFMVFPFPIFVAGCRNWISQTARDTDIGTHEAPSLCFYCSLQWQQIHITKRWAMGLGTRLHFLLFFLKKVSWN